ncbi:NYN domain-containing protein [Geomicrobium sp. JCM 19039]|uniref:NYN domain-containing protein n=1 Tax=Geomicrobium sp. JCM 19039 TaxID=1460636 RepID=UPI00045F4806|nr:NYN domain-containing protein [Geomicrobium sp. JCM 19039]GAK13852.1 hypothetical protein JCM19039_3729 [Geomicrobium sp. JCM 19039]
MKEYVVVDGYNIIGDWPELVERKKYSLVDARDMLIEQMAEYQAITGRTVIIVFDAHLVRGIGAKEKQFRVEVIYTKEKETADERIEKLVKKLKNVNTQVYVATSDYLEQRVIFGSGALRTSARELRNQLVDVEKSIRQTVKDVEREPNQGKIALSEEVAEFFDKWRRKGQ